MESAIPKEEFERMVSSQELEEIESENKVLLPKKLLADLHIFIASTNNYLLSQSVSGDSILQSAALMNKATELHNVLTQFERENLVNKWPK